MAWSASGVFAAFLENAIGDDVAFNIETSGDTIQAALYNNVGTPARDAALANTAYNAGAWVTANEVYDGSEWAQGGQVLTIGTASFSGTVYTLDAADEASAGSSFTGTAYGTLIYDQTVSGDYGLAFLYFGGAAGVVDGSITIAFHSSGIFTITV